MVVENNNEKISKIDELKNLSKSEILTEVNKLNNWIKDYSDVFKNAEWYLYKYIKKVQSALNEDWRGDDERAYKSLSKLKDSIRISKEKQKDSIWTSNEHLQRMINEVVDRIDNAENEMFEILKANKEQSYMKKQNEAIEKQSGKKFFEFDQKNNQYTFTEASNTPKIHEVLKYFFKDDKNVYTIDYSNCKNENIKKKMIDALWGTAKCSIKYNSDKWTYNLINESWEIPQRALIWEGVTLKTAKAGAYEAKVKQKAEAEKLPTYNEATFIGSQKYKALEESMWDTLKSKINTTTDRAKFMIETEQRLDKIIKTQKKRWWELENWEPVSRINFGSGLMEIHFINKEGLKEDITLWKDEKQLWKKLYDILDDNEGAYKNYLTMRIKEKWNEADRFSRRSQVFVWTENVEDNVSLQKNIENFSYWLGLIAKLVDKINDEDGTTKEVAALKVAVRNYLYSLENANPSEEEIKKAKQNLWDLFVKYKSNDWSWSRMSDNEAKSMISTILSTDRTNAQKAVRELWSKLNIFGNTKTTFLRDEIWENKDIGFNKKGFSEAFKKIGEKLELWENDPRMDEKIQLIDELYNNSWDTKSVFKFLKEKELIPAELAFSDEGVEDACKKIKSVLDARKNSLRNLNYGPNEFKASQEKEILKLEAKGNAITDEERIRLQSLRILIANPELMKEQIANAKQQAEFAIKYGDIAPMIRGSLTFSLAKNGNGMKWTNADIFNSSYWLNGRYDFSDETAVWLWEAGKMIIEEVAIAAVAIAAGALTGGAWAVAVYALRAAMTGAKIARVTNKASKIKRIFSAVKYYRQIWKNTEKAIQSAKLAKKAVNSAKNIEKVAKATKAIEKWSNTVKLLGVGNRVAEAGKTIEKWSNAVKLLGVGNRVAEAGKVIKTVDHIDDISKVGTLTKLAAKGTHLVFEGVGFNVTSTVLRNALNGKTLTEWLSDFKGYIHSIAFLWILKAIGGPLQNITRAGIKKILGEKYAANTLWEALQWITSIGAELWGLMLAEQGISLAFDQKLSKITGEGIVQSLGLILGLRAYGRGKMKIKNWRTSASGKLQDVTIEWENGKEVKIDPDWKVMESNVPTIIKGTDILNKKGKTQQKKIDTSKTEQKQIEAHKTEAKQTEAEKQTETEKQTKLEINENDSQSVKNIKAEINNAISGLKILEIHDNLYKSKRSKIKKGRLDTFDEIIRLNEDAITKRRQEIQDLKAKLNDQLKAEGKATQENTTEQNREQTKKESTTENTENTKTSEKEVQENNKQMDDILKWSAEKSIETKLKEIKDFIEKKLSKKFNKTIQLSEQAVKTLVGIRNLIKKFWKLTYKQLKAHIKTLSDMVKDSRIVKFLLEWWFCGRVKRTETKKEDLNNKEQRATEKEKIQKEDDIIFEKQEIKIEKSDKKLSFEKNNIEGFKEMFEKYSLNREEMPVGNFKGEKIVKSDLIKLLQENWYEAKHQIKIGKETIYLSDVFNQWRDYLVGYTADWEIRLFYKSQSEGIRRSCDWLRTGWGYSKWERIENYSYETTTQVEHQIGEFFDNLPQRTSWVDNMDPFIVIANKYGYIPNLLRPSLQTRVQVEKIGKFEHNNAVTYYQYKSVDAVQEFYRNLKTDITLTWISETYSFKHPDLWEIHVDIAKAKLKDGTDIEIHFWHAVNDNPNSVFIIRWDYIEWDVNSFGIRSNQLNLWPLWAKPIDYTSQAPIDWKSNNFKRYGEDYVDIRSLYQEMPLIKSYKEMIKKKIEDKVSEVMKKIRIIRSKEQEIKKIDFKTMSSNEILEYAKENYETIIKEYSKKMGKTVNVDDFRDFIWGEIWVDANKTHAGASYLADRYFEELLQNNRWKWNNTVKFLAGWPWSGKSSIDVVSPNTDYAAILDGTFKTYENAIKNIEKAKELGYKIRVEFVFRDINESFINGVLRRTVSQNISLKSKTGIDWLGRTVPIEVFEKWHNGSRNTILKLYEKYWAETIKFFWWEDKILWNKWIINILKTDKWIPPYVAQYNYEYIKNKIDNNKFDLEKTKNAIEEQFLLGRITEKQKKELLWEVK